MIPLTDNIRTNVYVREIHNSIALEKLQEAFKDNDIWDPNMRFFHAMIKYPQWHKDIDIFQFLNKKVVKKWRKNPKWFYLFDASTEGFSPLYGQTPFFDILYYNCAKYDISPKQIIFISANMVDEDNIIRYDHEHRKFTKKGSINVVSFNNFEQMLFGLHSDLKEKLNRKYNEREVQTIADYKYTEVLKDTKRHYYGEKYFLSLSRVNRPHRTLSAYELLNSKLFDKGLISHAPFNPKLKIRHIHQELPEHSPITEYQLQKFSRLLPLIVDTEDFKTNHAMSLNAHLHNCTLFQVVGETFAENWHGTSQFWSEKTFRSIFHMQPFLIWGQHKANQNLKRFGYKLYDKMFDYSFDDEPDTFKRWRMLLNVVNDTCKYLNKLTGPQKKELHLKWRFQQETVLRHNYKVMYKNEHTKSTMKKLAFKLKEISDETRRS